jgi:hypothetical protein
MEVYVIIFQGNNQFVARFPYSYTKTADGVYNFTAQTPDDNGRLIAQDMSPLLSNIANDNFTLDYFRDASVSGALGQLRSVQNPDFYFTGTQENL